MLGAAWITVEAYTKYAPGIAGRVNFGGESFVIEDDHGPLARQVPIATSTVELPSENLDRYRRSVPDEAHRSDVEVLHRVVDGCLKARSGEAKVDPDASERRSAGP